MNDRIIGFRIEKFFCFPFIYEATLEASHDHGFVGQGKEVHEKDNFFEVGKVYKSIDFTGATYTIEGAGNRRIGAALFEAVE